MFKLSAAVLLALTLTGCWRYRREDVSFRNGDTTLHGTLYTPSGEGPHPALVFVGGSGRAPRENVRWYAEFFAHRGVAALIYDKRDIGPVGATELVSADDLAGDASAAVRSLKARGDIDPARVGLWGGSQGSGVAARAAAQSGGVAFLISVSGGGVSYAELNAFQKANRLRAQGYAEEEVREAFAAMERLHEYVRTRKNPGAAQAALDRAWQNRWAPVVFPSRRLPAADELATWMQWRDIDGTSIPDWECVTVPVLAFWGEQDDIVPAQLSARRIREALGRAGNRDVTIMLMPGLDHNMMRQPNPRNVPAQEYLDAMLDWTLKRARVRE